MENKSRDLLCLPPVASFSIHTQDDSIDEDNGSITITLKESNDYTLLEQGSNSVTVAVQDNEEVALPTNQPKISVADSLVNAYLEQISSLFSSESANAEQSKNYAVLPTVSIKAVNSVIDEGEVAAFHVFSNSSQRSSPTNVILLVKPVGDFFDFNETKQISIPIQGQNVMLVEFQTIDDAIAENDGVIEVSIMSGPTYKIAPEARKVSVSISDAFDRYNSENSLTATSQLFLPAVTANMVARMADSVEQRVDYAFSETSEYKIKLGGHGSLTEMIIDSGEMLNSDSESLQSLLGNSSFSVGLLPAENSSVSTTLWGIGDYRSLTSNSVNNSKTWSGEGFNGHIGIDALINQEILTGVVATFSENQIEVEDTTNNDIKYSLNNTSINPFIGWTSSNQESELRLTAGYGKGELSIDHLNGIQIMDSKLYSLAFAGNHLLYSSDRILNGKSKLDLIGESWNAWQQLKDQNDIQTSLLSDAQHYRIRAEGTHQFEISNGSSLTPIVSMGMRGDKNSLQTKYSMEYIGGFEFRTPIGVNLSSSVSTLLGEENTFQSTSLDEFTEL